MLNQSEKLKKLREALDVLNNISREYASSSLDQDNPFSAFWSGDKDLCPIAMIRFKEKNTLLEQKLRGLESDQKQKLVDFKEFRQENDKCYVCECQVSSSNIEEITNLLGAASPSNVEGNKDNIENMKGDEKKEKDVVEEKEKEDDEKQKRSEEKGKAKVRDDEEKNESQKENSLVQPSRAVDHIPTNPNINSEENNESVKQFWQSYKKGRGYASLLLIPGVERLAEEGNLEAKFYLSRVWKESHPDLSLQLTTQAAEGGNLRAKLNLVIYYAKDKKGIIKDEQKAIDLILEILAVDPKNQSVANLFNRNKKLRDKVGLEQARRMVIPSFEVWQSGSKEFLNESDELHLNLAAFWSTNTLPEKLHIAAELVQEFNTLIEKYEEEGKRKFLEEWRRHFNKFIGVVCNVTEVSPSLIKEILEVGQVDKGYLPNHLPDFLTPPKTGEEPKKFYKKRMADIFRNTDPIRGRANKAAKLLYLKRDKEELLPLAHKAIRERGLRNQLSLARLIVKRNEITKQLEVEQGKNQKEKQQRLEEIRLEETRLRDINRKDNLTLKKSRSPEVKEDYRHFIERSNLATFDFASRELCRVIVNDGKLIRFHTDESGLQQQFTDTRNNFSHEKNGWAMLVINHKGEIFIHNHTGKSEGIEPKYVHSSFMGGAPVLFAGEIRIEHGIITGISNYSGHYCPDEHHMKYALEHLQKKGLNLDQCMVYRDNDLFLREEINDEMCLAAEFCVYSDLKTKILGFIDEQKTSINNEKMALRNRDKKEEAEEKQKIWNTLDGLWKAINKQETENHIKFKVPEKVDINSIIKCFEQFFRRLNENLLNHSDLIIIQKSLIFFLEKVLTDISLSENAPKEQKDLILETLDALKKVLVEQNAQIEVSRLIKLNNQIADYRLLLKITKDYNCPSTRTFQIKDKEVPLSRMLEAARTEIEESSRNVWLGKDNKQDDLVREALVKNPKLRACLFDNYEFFCRKEKSDFQDSPNFKIMQVKHKAIQLLKSKQGLFQNGSNNKLLKDISNKLEITSDPNQIASELARIQTDYKPDHALHTIAKIIRDFLGKTIKPEETKTGQEVTKLLSSIPSPSL